MADISRLQPPTPLQDPLKDDAKNPKKPSFKPCIGTMSLGGPSDHPLGLVTKLLKASQVGFNGIELFWDDFAAFCAANYLPADPADAADAHLVVGARVVRELCDAWGLTVVSLQPFRDFDGLLDEERKRERIREFRTWLACARVLGAGIIGVPASIASEGRSRISVVEDIRALVRMAAESDPPVTVAYEGLCFSAFVSTWQAAWDVVAEAGRGRGNVGIVLDTFNIGARVCTGPTGSPEKVRDPHQRAERCARQLAATIPPDRVALVQVADGEQLGSHVRAGHDCCEAGLSGCLLEWSRNCRLFPLEEGRGGCLPVVELLWAMTDGGGGAGGIGYEGWISLEVFSGSVRAGGVGENAERAWASWVRLRENMGWECS
jgi:4-hydroxyphenylpyruvate dioxygenase